VLYNVIYQYHTIFSQQFHLNVSGLGSTDVFPGSISPGVVKSEEGEGQEGPRPGLGIGGEPHGVSINGGTPKWLVYHGKPH
jgi:hypothetical protein